METIEDPLPGGLFTDILPAGIFYLAEDYHQKYLLRRNPGLMSEFSRMYPQVRLFIDSTAAAGVNGYLGGHGSTEQLQQEIKRLGLSPKEKSFSGQW